MAINYNLIIGNLGRKLSVDNFSNVVYEVSVSVSAYSEEYPQFTYSCGGLIALNISEISEQSFVPFEEVTQETVVGWLLDKEGVQTVEEFSLVKYSIENIQQRVDALQLQDTVSVSWQVSGTSTPSEQTELESHIQEDILEP